MAELEIDLVDGVAVLTIDKPPVNALTTALRAGLMEAFDALEADADVRAIVLAARGPGFSAGADIRDLDAPPRAPHLADLCNRIEACPVPVVAALHGQVLGGGLELALAAHYRVAGISARLGAPDVELGLVPGAGGTQRLPRIAGADGALELMLTGRTISAERARLFGLIDSLIEGEPAAAGAAYARALLAERQGPRPSRARRDGMSRPDLYLAEVARVRKAALSPAQVRIVACVEAALLLEFEAGLDFEQTAFDDLLASPQSAALRHLFAASRRALRIPERSQAQALPVERLAVVGAGRAGTGLAIAALSAGLSVRLVDPEISMLETGVEQIIDAFDTAVAEARLGAAVRDETLERLQGDVALSAVADCALVIEAGAPVFAAKAAMLADLDRILKGETILATTLGPLDLEALAGRTSRPQKLVGLELPVAHGGSRLVEVMVQRRVAPAAVVTVFEVIRRMGRQPLRCGPAPGSILRAVQGAYWQAADRMLAEGAGPAQIDAAMRAFGFAMGPLETQDLAGLDLIAPERKAVRPPLGEIAIAERLREAGRLGRKVGRGYHRYDSDSPAPQPDAEVDDLLEVERAYHGITPRAFAPDEIQRRCLAAMANAGARLIEAGVALRPGDIDVAMVEGAGFPRLRGGPMKAADLAGLAGLRRDLERYAAEEPALWQASPLFGELIKNGKTFDALNI